MPDPIPSMPPSPAPAPMVPPVQPISPVAPQPVVPVAPPMPQASPAQPVQPVQMATPPVTTTIPARPPRKTGKMLLGIGLLVVIVAGGGYGWVSAQSNAPAKASQAFISAIGGTQIDTAYGLTTTEFQKKYSKDEFAIGLEESNVTGKVSITKITDRERTDDRATVRGSVQHDKDGTGSLEVALMKENSAWRVKNFSVKVGTAITLDSAAELTKSQAYSETKYGFSSRYLRGWEKMDLPEVYGTGVAFKSPVENSEDTYRDNVVVTIDELVGGATLSQLTDFLIAYHQEETPGFVLDENKALKLGGEDAHMISFTSEGEGIKAKQMQIWTIKENKAYSILYSALSDSYDKFLPGAETVITYFKFL